MKSFKLKLKLNICTRGVFITENRRGLKPFEPDLVDTSVGKCVEPNINMSNGLFYFESVIYDSFTLRNFPSEGCVFFFFNILYKEVHNGKNCISNWS